MRNFTVRGLPVRVLLALEERAKERAHTLNAEIVLTLGRSLEPEPLDPEAFLARVDRQRRKLRLRGITEARLRKDKRWGRP